MLLIPNFQEKIHNNRCFGPFGRETEKLWQCLIDEGIGTQRYKSTSNVRHLIKDFKSDIFILELSLLDKQYYRGGT